VVGFYGQGTAVDLAGTDQVVYPVPVAPALSAEVTLGVTAGFPIYPQTRTYFFCAVVTAAGT